MAVSLATRLTPYTDGGPPKVVITGRFFLGCCVDSPTSARSILYMAPFLDLRCFARARGVSTTVGDTGGGTFSLRVSGRADGLGEYTAPGLKYPGNGYYDRRSQASSSLEAFYANVIDYDLPFLVRIFRNDKTDSNDEPLATKDYYLNGTNGWDGSDYSDAFSRMAALYPDMTDGSGQSLTITVEGLLETMDLTLLKAAACDRDPRGISSGTDYAYNHFSSTSYPSNSPSAAWALDHVDIYSQQGLQRSGAFHVSDGDAGKVVWH